MLVRYVFGALENKASIVIHYYFPLVAFPSCTDPKIHDLEWSFYVNFWFFFPPLCLDFGAWLLLNFTECRRTSNRNEGHRAVSLRWYGFLVINVRLSDIQLNDIVECIHCTIHCCQYVVTAADEKAIILSAITTLKSLLAGFIEPDFGLLSELLHLDVLTRRQVASVRKKETVFDRNDALLDLLTSEEQCVKFLTALQQSGQQHVVNFITQNGGQKHHDVT